MDFIHKKTTELSDKEIEQFCSLYSIVFCKPDKSIDSFKEEYLNSALGYSYHSLMFSEGELVGAHNEIPVNYQVDGEDVVFCVGADVMIKQGFRNFLNLAQLVRLSEKSIKDDGIHFIFGFPNEKAYSIFNIAFKYKDIGNLRTYILPYRIGGIKPQLKFLNPLSILAVHFLANLSRLRINTKPTIYLIDKDRETQLNYRLKWHNGNYKVYTISDFNFVYTIFVKDGIRTAFLIDMDKVSPANLSAAVRYIIKMDSKNFDLILYAGNLAFNSFPLIKIPHKFEPKKMNFHGKYIGTKKVDERLFNIENWNVNLLCYDLV